MAKTTFVNTRGVVHKGSGSTSTVFPDVCLTQVGKPVVPIPYANLGEAKDTVKGPKTVTVDGEMPMVKGALYSKSSGDEPGTKNGVLSGTHKGMCEFLTYSFDVKIEGRNVCRLGDMLFHNKKNVLG